MNRRDMLSKTIAMLAGVCVRPSMALSNPLVGEEEHPEMAPSGTKELWQALDATIRNWWVEDLTDATEDKVCSHSTSGSRLFLPFPYVRISPGHGLYSEMFPFDTAMMNYGLLAHGKSDLVRSHILNALFQIERYGFIPNANAPDLLTRSQVPLIPSTLWQYYIATQDRSLLERAYPILKMEYRHYWNAPHHQTPIGLSTCRDLGDRYLSPELASEAETGMDWMPIYDGDVRRCVPLNINCALVRYAGVLAALAKETGHAEESRAFLADAQQRAALIRKYCWNPNRGMFLEYDYVAREQLPYVSACAYWTLWAGVATRAQARALHGNLPLLEKPFGLSETDRSYPDPHPTSAYILKNVSDQQSVNEFVAPDAPPEYLGGRGPLMWSYPAGWATTQIICIAGLDRYAYREDAKRLSTHYLRLLLDQYRKTGQLWEKYNVVDGSLVLPNSRYGNIPYHSFTATAVVLLGQRIFENHSLAKI